MAEGSLYEFRIAATNLVGIGQPSDPSELFKCEAWTAPEPGKTVSPGLTPGYLACTRRAGRRGGLPWRQPRPSQPLQPAGFSHSAQILAPLPHARPGAELCLRWPRPVVWAMDTQVGQ